MEICEKMFKKNSDLKTRMEMSHDLMEEFEHNASGKYFA